MRADQSGIILGIAGHMAPLQGDETPAIMAMTQPLVLVTGATLVGHDRAAVRQRVKSGCRTRPLSRAVNT